MQTQVSIRMVFRVKSNFCEPGARHHDAGGTDGLFVQSVEAGSVHGMGHGKIVRMNDKEFRIGGIAEAFGHCLILRMRGARGDNQERGSDGVLSKVHGKLQQASLAVKGNTADEVPEIRCHRPEGLPVL